MRGHNINLCCDPSLELSHRDSSNEGSQHMLGNKKKISLNYPQYPLLSGALVKNFSKEHLISKLIDFLWV